MVILPAMLSIAMQLLVQTIVILLAMLSKAMQLSVQAVLVVHQNLALVLLPGGGPALPLAVGFNADISLPYSGLLHTAANAEEDTTDTSSELYSALNYRGCSIRSLATALRLNAILDWIEQCKLSEKVEACRSKKWVETTLVTHEGYKPTKIGLRGALYSGASIQELRSSFTRGNQAIAAHRNSLKYESNKIKKLTK